MFFKAKNSGSLKWVLIGKHLFPLIIQKEGNSLSRKISSLMAVLYFLGILYLKLELDSSFGRGGPMKEPAGSFSPPFASFLRFPHGSRRFKVF